MQTAINGGGGLMSTLRKSYSVGDVSSDNNPVHRRTGRGGAVLQALDEHDRAPSRNQVQSAPISSMDDSDDTEEFDELFDEIGEEPVEGIDNVKKLLTFKWLTPLSPIYSRYCDETTNPASSSRSCYQRGVLY